VTEDERIPSSTSKFRSDLSRLVRDPQIRALAQRRALSRELAEDALQDTYYTVARTQDPGGIKDLRAFFCKSLIRTIHHQHDLAAPIPAWDIDAVADSGRDPLRPGTSPPDAVEGEAAMLILAEAAFNRLERDQAGLLATIPARSDDPHRYRCTILTAARTILYQLLKGTVTTADWNAALRSGYPQWCDEPGLPSDAAYQRLSRARADVQQLLRVILPRDMIAS